MKKLCIVFLLSAVSLAAGAQPKNDVAFSFGFMPTEFFIHDPDSDYGFAMGLDLYSDYEPRETNFYSTPSFELGYSRFVTKSVKLGAMVSYSNMSYDLYDPVQAEVTDQVHKNYYSLFARALYCYRATDKGECYSGVGVGAQYVSAANSSGLLLAYEVVPFGFRLSRLPILFEIVLGKETSGFRAGFCYRF